MDKMTVEELINKINILQLEIETIKERLDDIKPFSIFIQEQEKLEELEDELGGSNG